jgi:hypothetical protein
VGEANAHFFGRTLDFLSRKDGAALHTSFNKTKNRATMSSDKARKKRVAPQEDNESKDEPVPPPQSLALRRGMAPLQVSLAAGTHQAAPRVTPSTTASSVTPFSFLPYGIYHPHMLSPMPHPSPEIPMSLELTLAIGRAALQENRTRNADEDAGRDAFARDEAVLSTPQTLEIRNSSMHPGKQQDSVAGEQKESVSLKSSAAVGEPSLTRMPQPSAAVGERKATVASMPESSNVVEESVATVSVAEKEDSLIRQEEEDSKKAEGSITLTRTSPRTTRSTQTPTERAISPEKAPLSSSQRRKQRKDMPIVPGGGVVTVTPHSPIIRPPEKKQKRKKEP